MNNSTKKLLVSLINDTDVNDLMTKWLEDAVNELLNNELSCFLRYSPYERREGPIDYRNGYYCRVFQTKFGMLHIKIPRDRNCDFTQHVIPPYQRNSGSLERMIIGLYQNGMTTRNITRILKAYFGNYYSPQAISHLAK